MNCKTKIENYLNNLEIAKDLNMRLGILMAISLEFAIQQINNKEEFLKLFPDINNINDLNKTINILYSKIEMNEKQIVFKELITKTINEIEIFNKDYFIFGFGIAKDFKENFKC